MNDTVKGILAVVVIIAAIFVFKGSSEKQAQSQDFPNGTYWVCLECKHQFNMSRDAVADWNTANPEKTVPCPECEKNRSVSASKCPLPECGELYTGSLVEIDGAVCCPVCKQAVP